MTKLLFIKASPRGAASKSVNIAETYLDTLHKNNPELEIDTIDLWNSA